MSLIAEDRQGQAREKEHSKHSSRNRHSRLMEVVALVMCCPDIKALLGALPFLENQFLLQGNSAPDTLAVFLFLKHTKLISTTGPLHLLCTSTGNAFLLGLVRTGAFLTFSLHSNVKCSEVPSVLSCSKEAKHPLPPATSVKLIHSTYSGLKSMFISYL